MIARYGNCLLALRGSFAGGVTYGVSGYHVRKRDDQLWTTSEKDNIVEPVPGSSNNEHLARDKAGEMFDVSGRSVSSGPK